jgi:tRNA wybutosine-synthesizing protein 4
VDVLCCRYLSAGWEVASAKDLDDIYENELGAEELQRVAKLELFDEFEEWHMISQHYTYD